MLTGILQPTHLIVIVIVALVFLGPKRLPSAGRALGQGLREFKDSIGGEAPVDEPPPTTDLTPLPRSRSGPVTASAVGESAGEPGSAAA